VAVALIVGIIAEREWAPSPVALVGLGAAALVAATALVVWRPGSRLARAGVLWLVAAVGATVAWLAATPLDPADLDRFAGPEPALARLVGRVVSEPHVSDPNRGHQVFRPVFGPSTSFALDTEALVHQGMERRVSGPVVVIVREPVGHVHGGDRVAVVGRLTAPGGPTNPGERSQRLPRLAAFLTTDHAEAVTRLAGPSGGAPFSLIGALRRHLANTITRRLPPRQAGLLLAILTGDRRRIESDLKRAFVLTGTLHLLAISGLNVTLLAGAAFWLLQRARLPERPALGLATAFVFLYAMVVGFEPPVLRAAVMVAVIMLSRLFRHDAESINSLGVGAVIVLLADPGALFEASFQLTFVTTLGILLFAGPMDRWLHAGLRVALHGRRDRRAIEAAARTPRRPRLRLNTPFFRIPRQTVGASWVASAVAAPVTAYYFRFLAAINAIATPLVLPFFWLAVVLGMALCILEVFGLGALVAPIVALDLRVMGSLLEFFAMLQGDPRVFDCTVGLGTVLICYTGFGVFALRYRLNLTKGRLALALWLTAAGAAWSLARDVSPPAAPELTALDLGHGQCVLLRTPEGRSVLFDAGALFRRNAAATIEHALLALGVRRLDLIVLSHPDLDHFSAVPELLSAFPTGAVAVSSAFLEAESPEPKRLLALVADAGVPVLTVGAGDAIAGLEPLALTVLHPSEKDRALGDNDQSLVIQASHGSTSALTTGDLQSAGIDALVRRGWPAAAQVLVAPHHGHAERHLAALVEAVKPRRVVVSGPGGPRVDLARPAYTAGGASLHLTGDLGAITVTLSPDLPVRTWRADARPR
jgi:competence protein ComEC